MDWTIEEADVLEWAGRYEGPPAHAILTDPPYHLGKQGFMGRKWDASGVAFNPETWAALATHLHPGAFGMAFASARGWHRLAVAIEDAGLIIHPSIFGWAFGSGFPKATRVPDERFDEHRYGLQAMKPALEPIILFQKPYATKPVESIVATGAGALWIDGARTPTRDSLGGGGYMTPVSEGWDRPWRHDENIRDEKEKLLAERVNHAERLGRWPANLALIHHPDCNGSCVPGCPIREMDLQAGVRPPFGSKAGDEPSPSMSTVYSGGLKSLPWEAYNDTGGASRFFYSADWMLERLEKTSPVFYAPKASTSERDNGLVSAPMIVTDGRNKSIDNPYLRGETLRRNTHPCVKPLSLTIWLARLLLPPVEYAPRRLLVPFSGVGSEVIGAGLAGWDFCQGVELNKSDDGSDYIAIAKARLKYWLEAPIITMTNQEGETVEAQQMRMDIDV